MVMPNLSLSAGGGGPSAATSNAGVQTPISTPFNFDGSGWVINFGAGNSVTAGGNTGANQTSQTPDGAGGGGLLSGLGLGNVDPKIMLVAGVVLLLVMKR